MEENILEATLKTKNMDLVIFSGQTGENIKDNG